MLIIGHRGAAAIKPDNSIAGLREAIRAGADMVEFDVRITQDGVAVLSHDNNLYLTHKKINFITTHTLDELKKRTAGSDNPTVTFRQALKECYGKIFMNIEVKEVRAVDTVLKDIAELYGDDPKQWESLLFTSFKPLVLRRLRKHSPDIQLGMLHHVNPLNFIAWQKQLNLTAVGFHRLNINRFALEVAKQLDLFTYVYTVNRPDALVQLAKRDIDAIVTDNPAAMKKAIAKRSI